MSKIIKLAACRNEKTVTIGKMYRSKHTGEWAKVMEIKKQPKHQVFLKDKKYRHELHVCLKTENDNIHAAVTGYPMSIFKENFVEV